MKTLTEEQIKKLNEPLPAEALHQHPSRSYLTAIKAIYVTERLNDVFGVGTWSIKTDYVGREGKMVVCKVTLEIKDYGIYYESFGGNDNEDLGDAYKGASTDAITKIASYMGIGAEVFKGKANLDQQQTKPTENKGVSVDEIKNASSVDELKKIYERVQQLKSDKAKNYLTSELSKKKEQLLTYNG